MNTQPEALRLAHLLEQALGNTFNSEAAAELRRLHSAAIRIALAAENIRLETLNAELLEALRELVEEATAVWGYGEDYPHIEIARAAIAKATGEQT